MKALWLSLCNIFTVFWHPQEGSFSKKRRPFVKTFHEDTLMRKTERSCHFVERTEVGRDWFLNFVNKFFLLINNLQLRFYNEMNNILTGTDLTRKIVKFKF